MSSVSIPPSTLPPSGSAGGELGGQYPNPTVNATHSGTAHHTAFVQADHDALANPHHSNANDHAASHTLTSHSTRAHSELTGIGATDHHSNANDHANTLDHSNSNDPTANQKLALAGTGTPSGTDKYVNDSDARNTNSRTPTAHASTHDPNGSDPKLFANGSYAPGSVTIPTGTFAIFVDTFSLTGSQTLTMNGTAALRGI